MSSSDYRHVGSRLFDACVSVSIAAMALYVAVWLLAQIWPWLVGIAVVLGVVLAARWWWLRW